MTKWTDERERSLVVRSRHTMITYVSIGFFTAMFLIAGVGGCTYHAVEQLKVPVKVEHKDSYERSGNSNE